MQIMSVSLHTERERERERDRETAETERQRETEKGFCDIYCSLLIQRQKLVQSF